MDVSQAIQERRAYRSLAPIEITAEIVDQLAQSVRLAPSCFNSQPWRFVFVSDPDVLKDMHSALSAGNAWARAASLIIAVFSRAEDDCMIRDRHYHQFDTGMGVGFLILKATDMGLVAHPIAGFSPRQTRLILNIPDEYQVITLVIVGKHADRLDPLLTEEQRKKERERPTRLDVGEFVYVDRFEPGAGSG
jgi:nitroreductase